MTTTKPSTSTTPTSKCSDLEKALGEFLADLAAAEAAAGELEECRGPLDELVLALPAAVKLLPEAKKAATESVAKARAARCRLQGLLECRLTEDELRELDKCAKDEAGKAPTCDCDAIVVGPVCLCGAPPAGTTAPNSWTPIDKIESMAATCLKIATDLVAMPQNLVLWADELVAVLNALEADLTAGKVEDETGYLILKIIHDPRLEELERWTDPKYKTSDFQKAAQAAICGAICVCGKLACARAAKAKNDKLAEMEAACEKADDTKDPIERALECYDKAPPPQGHEAQQQAPASQTPATQTPATQAPPAGV